ncbi:hypothetical protein WR25_19866 [Diploscapter pachys]|uniref:Uncharacterized protein n=1 Tax=Diploscapter pachys TaxID=2018661 RepID=A0A2A2JWP5_9BILA|nr:hypothetical protein WR25_19866 [Diploscapter pachys]
MAISNRRLLLSTLGKSSPTTARLSSRGDVSLRIGAWNIDGTNSVHSTIIAMRRPAYSHVRRPMNMTRATILTSFAGSSSGGTDGLSDRITTRSPLTRSRLIAPRSPTVNAQSASCSRI